MKKSHRQKHRDQIKKFAAEAFENHIITRESEIMWLCKRPGTIVYHFRVLTPPGAVLIYGDIGDLFLRQYHRSLPWIRGSATNPDSPDYVLGKVPLRFVEKEFLPEEAREYLEVEFPTGDYYPEDQVKEIKEEYKWYIDQDSDGYHCRWRKRIRRR